MEDNIYPIPKNLNECFDVLDEIFNESEEDKKWLRSTSEEDVTNELHHGLGRWIRNSWGLWSKDTELYNVLHGMGLWHPDNMSSVITTSYHRKIHSKELNLKEQIQHHIDYWKDYEKTNGPVEKE